MLIYLELITKLGTFNCEPIEVNNEQYQKLLEYSKTFHQSEVFDSLLKNNEGHVIVPQHVLNESILVIRPIQSNSL